MKANDLMQMLGLKEPTEQLALANSVHWNDHMMREDGQSLKKALELETEGQRETQRTKGHVETKQAG